MKRKEIQQPKGDTERTVLKDKERLIKNRTG